MISWICKDSWVDWSPKKIRGGITVRNRNTKHRRRSGHAWPSRERIVVSIGTAELFRPYLYEEDDTGKKTRPRKDESGEFMLGSLEEGQVHRIRQLVDLMAHEIVHLAQWDRPKARAQYSEREANGIAKRVLGSFKEKEEELTAAWMKAPAYADRPKKEKPTRKQVNAERAQQNLKTWERKLKLAKTKVDKYRKQVRRYEKEGVLCAAG